MMDGSQSSGISLRFPRLNDRNYRSWKLDMKWFLHERGLHGFIDEKSPELIPTREEEEAHPGVTRQFAFRQSRALATIALGLEVDLKTLIRTCTTAKEAWKALASVFEPKSRARIGHLRKEFVLMHMQPNESMAKYLARVQNAVTDLAEAGKTIDEEEQAYQMICGLPSEWDSIVERLYALGDDEFKPLTIKDSLLSEFERRYPTLPPLLRDEASTEAMTMGYQRSGRGRDRRRQQSRSPSRANSNMRNDSCYSCGTPGHFARDCRNPNSRNESRGKSNRSRGRGRSDKRQALLAEANVVAANELQWTLDTAATHHFCTSRDWFCYYKEVNVRPAMLAEGTSRIEGIGDVTFDAWNGTEYMEITLQDVMYAPNMRRNLISGNRIFKNGCKITSNKNGLLVINPNGVVVIEAPLEDNFFVVKGRRIEASGEAYPCEKEQSDNMKNARPTSEVPNQVNTMPQTSVMNGQRAENMNLWHMRLGHINTQAMKRMMTNKKVRGIQSLSGDMKICDACQLGKSTRARHVTVDERSARAPLELVHTDVWGPAPVDSCGGSRYFISFIDDFSRKCFVYTMRTKNEAFAKFKTFLAKAERQTGRKLQRLRSDNGMEYCANYFKEELARLGIQAERTNIYSPQMNGVAERLNRSLLDTVRTLLIDSKLSAEWWAEMLMTAAYLKNKTSHAGIQEEVPDELYSNRQPSVGHLKRIGSLCFVYNERRTRTKLQPRSKLGILVGYAFSTRGYRVWTPDDGKYVIETQSVRFDEKRLGVEALRNAQMYKHVEFTPDEVIETSPLKTRQTRRRYQNGERNSQVDYTVDDVLEPLPPVRPNYPVRYREVRHEEAQERIVRRAPIQLQPAEAVSQGSSTLATETREPVRETGPLPGWEREVAIRQSGRDAGKACIYYRYLGGPRQRSHADVGRLCIERQLPYEVDRFDFSTKNTVPAKGKAIEPPSPHSPLEHHDDVHVLSEWVDALNETVHGRTSRADEEDDGNEPFRDSSEEEKEDEGMESSLHPEAFCAEVHVPTTYAEAIRSPQAKEWQEAMNEEMNTLKERQVFTKVKTPSNKKTIGSRWVFAVKQDARSKSLRYRARLVAQGNTQKRGQDFFETYSPVIAFALVRFFFIILVICLGWTSNHLDVKCAYLYGTLNEETYLKPAPGFGDSTQTSWLLHKALYGLHQSGRRWFVDLDQTFATLGFKKLLTTNCIYTYQDRAVVLVYVDDLAIFAKDKKTKQEVIALISSKYEVKDLGELRRFLGVEFEKYNGRWKIHQRSYVEGLAKHFAVDNFKNVLVPLDAGVVLTKGKNQTIGVADTTRYRALIGALMFLATRTRPDLLFSVIALAQFNSSPTFDHWRLLQRVLAYAYTTKSLGIMCQANLGTPVLEFFTDSSWATSIEDRKSWSGYVGLLAGIPATWRAQKQRSIALSTMEAEYIGLSNAVMEVKWIVAICRELPWLGVTQPITIYCDNEAAIAFASDYREHMQSKHIDLRYKFVREAIHEETCTLKFVRSKSNIADIFTKPLPRVPYERMRQALVT